MGLKLYFAPGSYYSQKAVLALAEKGLAFEEKHVALTELEQYQPSYLKINQKAQVPVLQDGDEFIADSSAIICYLDAKYGDRTLLPDVTSQLGQEVQRCVEMLDSINVPLLTYGTIAHLDTLETKDFQMAEERLKKMKNLVGGSQMTDTLKRMGEEHPDMAALYEAKREQIAKLGEMCGNLDVVRGEIEKTRGILQQCDKLLEGRPENAWLCGEHFTAADIIMAIFLARTILLGHSKLIWADGRLPALEAYQKRLMQRPSIKAASISV